MSAFSDFGYERIDSPGRSTATPGQGPFTTGQSRQASVTITQTVFNGFLNDADNENANLAKRSAEISLEEAMQNILFEGVSIYLEVLRNLRLIQLAGGFAVGSLRSGSESDKQELQLMVQMMEQGWGQDNPAFRQFFTSLFMPGATKEQMDWFNELERVTASPENAARILGVTSNIDVVDLLPRISVPTLVLHCREDGMVPFDKGRKMAAAIPDARFVALEGNNHLFIEDEPAWPRFLDEVTTFLAAEDLDDG